MVILVSTHLQKYFFSESKLDKIPIKIKLKIKKLIKGQIKDDIKSKRVTSSVNKIMARLKNNIEEMPYEIEVIIIDSPMVNAAACPGGLIILFSGLIRKSDSPEELASVLAHELGHIVHKDPIKKLGREFGLAVLISLGGGSDSAVIIKRIMKAIVSSSFTRNQEAKADDYGCNLMIKSGLSPVHFAEFMKKLDESNISKDMKKLLKYISTHPDTQSRIKKAEEKADLFRGRENKFNINWKRVKRSLPSSWE